LEWGWDVFRSAVIVDGPVSAMRELTEDRILVRRIGVADLREALARGMADFGAARTDVIFLCLVYPVVGLVLARLAVGEGILPLLFPLAAGFALIGPLAAVGLNEMSRQRELTGSTRWGDTFGVVRSSSPGGIAGLGVVMVVLFLVWMVVAAVIYEVTMGPALPGSVGSFVSALFGTAGGWALIVLGVGGGFLFAAFALAITIVSFPLLLDRRVSAATAVRTSVRVVSLNPVTCAIWGLVVVAGLVAGSIPFFVGLVVVLPVLGHATWHLYRRAVSFR
jgi:uncharacterized membrane protein